MSMNLSLSWEEALHLPDVQHGSAYVFSASLVSPIDSTWIIPVLPDFELQINKR